MKPFSQVRGPAISLPEANIDTDVIFPARFLVITASEGLGRYAFYDRRYDTAGNPQPDCVFNRPEMDGAPILVTGANFGCGSSREQAVWAIMGMGLTCIIAPSFGEIFAANCIRNGILTVCLDDKEIAKLHLYAAAGAALSVDLQGCAISVDGAIFPFAIAEHHRQALLNGWDETDTILAQDAGAIADFEGRQRMTQPWLYIQGESR
ncbi:3-isopropylmalate dehydratase small subunit [Sphingorhabdus contaminans]|jgi:3-isopropylmalate/(R)-2-methylmalate dehydratase small subunit|uniref:3-isopropylmalate dehydratase n=1 Tax=Sphingorhabdus contaminans TaxID=1343899 RepID=A0A553WAG1_9SPHN|nr:3-isopropylmalate dehydratase small subunit [Sphingorhabdus contaminans]TSB01666.1 3-isopropylmalate dehydratase small subunit [Sphingorhabdus contaminans]